MLGDDQSLSLFASWVEDRRPALTLVYATGRCFEEVVDLIDTTELPEPDAIACNVGTEIRLFPSGNIVADWHNRIAPDWDGARVRELLSREHGLSIQPRKWQSDLKASFYLEDADDDKIDAIFDTLWRAGIFPEIIYSSNRDLDVLPVGGTKGSAAAYLASALGIPRNRVIVSGDSGNDLSMFRRGFKGITVGNSHDELRQLDSPLVYHALQPYAAGVLEGLRFWEAVIASRSLPNRHAASSPITTDVWMQPERAIEDLQVSKAAR